MQSVGLTTSSNYRCLEDMHGDTVDLSLSYCGTENCTPGFGFGPAVRTKYVIHVVTEGHGKFEVNGVTYPLKKGDAFAIYPEVETYYEASVKDPWSYIWVGFHGIKALECVANCGFTPEHPVVVSHALDPLINCIEQLIDAHQLTFANELKRTGLLMNFLSILIEDYVKHNSTHTNYDYSGTTYVKHAVTYLSKNYSQKIKITELANYIGVNRSYLTNSFKKVMNMSPQEFLVNLRMDKAVSLLQNTALPINTIAIQIGYDDPLAFSKIFKKKYGISPRQFRETPGKVIHKKMKGDYPGHLSL